MKDPIQLSQPLEALPFSAQLGALAQQKVNFRRPVPAMQANHLPTTEDLLDRFLLYRIIGNDLVHRHSSGQSIENLEFILDYERNLLGCEKRWIVNRIFDKDKEDKIVKILKDRDQLFIRIPFDINVYRKIPTEIEVFPSPSFFLDEVIPKSAAFDLERREAQLRLNRRKTLYAMNVNGARNAALDEGKRYAKWILPWDGNCFVSQESWSQIVDEVKAKPFCKYFYVPMARTLDNVSHLQTGYSPQATEEPQLIFRYDSAEEFDERIPYGQRSKLELLWRLGVPCGHWDSRVDFVWDLPRPTLSMEAAEVASAGWVARLSSGQPAFELGTVDSSRARSRARFTAIVTTLRQLDTRAILEFLESRRLRLLNEKTLVQLTEDHPSGSSADQIKKELKRNAELALRRVPHFETTQTIGLQSGDRHGYFDVARYQLPLVPYNRNESVVNEDGKHSVERYTEEPAREDDDRSSIQQMLDDSVNLALAWFIFSDQRFAIKCAELVRAWFLTPDTRMNPRFDQLRSDREPMDGSYSGLIEMKDLCYFLDAIRILEGSGQLTETELSDLQAWLEEYLDWLQSSQQGIAARKAKDSYGTCYDLQVAGIAAYLGDAEKLVAIFQDSRQRILSQFDAVGRQRRELGRSRPLHCCAFNLQCWVNLAKIAQGCGQNLWEDLASDGRGLRRGLDWLFSSLDFLLLQEDRSSAYGIEGLRPLTVAYETAYGLPAAVTDLLPNRGPVPANFHPRLSVMPFWQLC